MEKHPIETWDHLVCHNLSPAKLKNLVGDKGKELSLLDESKAAREQTRTTILREAFLRKARQENKILIQQYQVFFTNLLDLVFEYQLEAEIPFELQKVYEQVRNDLESIFRFLENSFPDYFNLHGSAPKFIRSKFEKSTTPQLVKLKKRLGELEKNQQIIESVFSILEYFIQPAGHDRTTLYQLKYLKTLVETILNVNIELAKNSNFSTVFELLISLKFNDERFLQLVMKKLKESISLVESEDEKFKLLKELYKDISQILEYNLKPLHPDQITAKEIILDWLSQEIYFNESCIPKKENAPATSSAKINTSLSVPVLALYIRLLKEEGIITNNNHSELFRVVSSTFTTGRNADVAHSHLHSKFYAIEESARRKVFDQLMSMAHLCKRIG